MLLFFVDIDAASAEGLRSSTEGGELVFALSRELLPSPFVSSCLLDFLAAVEVARVFCLVGTLQLRGDTSSRDGIDPSESLS